MSAMTFLAIIGAVALAVPLLVALGIGLMLLGGGTLTFAVTTGSETVRKRFGRETGWRWVEDRYPTR